jgi:F-type H+-transporting ATPase subunit b
MLEAIKAREDKIEQALVSAQKATEEYQKMEESKAKMAAEARIEREQMLNEARAMKDSIVGEAKAAAQAEAEKVMTAARAQIEKEKQNAIVELKQQVARLSVEIAGKILAENLKADGQQEKLIEKYLNESNFN